MSRKAKERLSPPALGGTTLLVIFAVLCLVVFSLLSLSTVQAERKLSNASRDAATAYYKADLEAQRVFALIRNGEEIPGVKEENGVYSYVCKVTEDQNLAVEIQKNEEKWQVLRWQCVVRQGEIDDTLPVWSGY